MNNNCRVIVECYRVCRSPYFIKNQQ